MLNIGQSQNFSLYAVDGYPYPNQHRRDSARLLGFNCIRKCPPEVASIKPLVVARSKRGEVSKPLPCRECLILRGYLLALPHTAIGYNHRRFIGADDCICDYLFRNYVDDLFSTTDLWCRGRAWCIGGGWWLTSGRISGRRRGGWRLTSGRIGGGGSWPWFGGLFCANDIRCRSSAGCIRRGWANAGG
jgi:hypothetical protein